MMNCFSIEAKELMSCDTVNKILKSKAKFFIFFYTSMDAIDESYKSIASLHESLSKVQEENANFCQVCIS